MPTSCNDNGLADVSVVVPVRNGAAYLADAVASALRQRFVLEVIVVDDGSTDDTPVVLASLAHHQLRVARQAPAGAASARNHGVSLARGALLAFLDADDVWLEGKIARQREVLLQGPAELVFTGLREFISPDLPVADAGRLRPRDEVVRGIAITTMLVRRSDFERAGPFRADLRIGEFLDWFTRAGEAGLTSHVVPDLFCLRRLHLGNQGRSNGADRSAYALILREMLVRRRTTPLGA